MSDTLSEGPPIPITVEEPELLPLTCQRLYRRSQLAAPRSLSWVWDGYLARGYVTLLTGQWKIGKSTLLAALLARLAKGGELAGRAVSPGQAVVVTEEEAGPWLRRIAKHDIGDEAAFLFNPFIRRPVPDQWDFLIEDLRDRHRRRPTDLIVLDTLSAFLPGTEESSARAMTNALRPLRDLAANGTAVLLLHHPRKGPAADGQAARGTGALSAGVDTIVEYRWAGAGRRANRYRRLLTWSRHEGAPAHVVVRFDPCGTGYTVVPECAVPREPDEPDDILMDLVRESPDLTADEVIAAWPADGKPLGGDRIKARLSDLVNEGRLTRTGAGHRWDLFRYREADGEVSPVA